MSGIQQLLLGGPFGPGAPGDPNWQNVNLLLGTTTTNGGQNNTFIDSSTNNFTITRNGNTTQGSFTPFSQAAGYWSNYFDGSSSYLSFSSNSALAFGTSNITIEFWVNYADSNGNYLFYDARGTNISQTGIAIFVDGGTLYVNSALTNIIGDGVAPSANTWHHIAYTRSGSSNKIFVDGVQTGSTGTDSTNFSTAYSTSIGSTLDSTYTASYSLKGYISNLRVLKGTAQYTANFTPPTSPLTAITNTQLLTCQSNRFVDNSSNAIALTATGSPSVVPFQPFGAPTSPYNTTNVGGSGYFDGSGDYLSVSSLTFNPRTTVFTVEGWFYRISGTTVAFFGAATSTNFYVSLSGNSFYVGDGSLNTISGAGTGGPLGAWEYIAMSFDGTTYRLYQNGVLIGSSTTLLASNTVPLSIGAYSNGSAPLTGYSSGVRFSNTARYTGSTMTVPTAPFTNDVNTSLLCNFTNANIYDQAAKNDFETVGNAQVSTSVTKFGNSLSLDGTGDYLITQAPTNQLTLGTGEFTIEFWVYFNSLTSTTGNEIWLFDFRPTTTNGLYPVLYMDSTNNVLYYYINGATAFQKIYTFTTSTWYHVALNRCANGTKLYINGVQLSDVYIDSQSYLVGANRPVFGATGYTIGQYQLNGYFSNIRITKGVGRYPYPFTPPTQAFGTIYAAPVTTASDPYFNYTTLLLPGSGTNGAQNNTFLDSSTNAFSITRNGNTTQGTFSPFSAPSATSWSNYFDGTGDYLNVATATLNPRTDSFTIEGWIYMASSAAQVTFVGSTSNNNFYVVLNPVNRYIYIGDGSINAVEVEACPAINSWHYIATTFDGTTYRFYVDGVRFGSGTTLLASNSVNLTVGARNNGAFRMNGYLSNVRYVKGSALYTGTTMTVPTAPLTAVSGTEFLTCQSNRFVDNSANAYAITVNGDTSVQAFSPFAPTAAYSAATNGGSGYFDGTGDYLDIANNSVLTPSGDFTIEFWAYVTDSSGTQEWYSKGYGIQLYISSPSWGVAFSSNNDGNYFVNLTSSSDVQINAWTHFAVTRSGNSYRFFINGVQQGSTVTSSSAPNTGTSVLRLGNWSDTPAYGAKGYMAGVRYLNGTAQYTANFTPPTSPPTAITNTTFLCNFTNAGITDATAKNDLETVGNAQISTAQYKWNSSSMYFDGTGDYLLAPSNININFGNGDFTIEYWIYFVSTTGTIGILTKRATTAAYAPVLHYLTSGNWAVKFSTGGTTWDAEIITSITPSTSTWYHVAISKYGSTVKLFVNGQQLGSATISNLMSNTTALSIGSYAADGNSPLNGYIQDLRVTKGIARYTQNFTPPTAAFQLL